MVEVERLRELPYSTYKFHLAGGTGLHLLVISQEVGVLSLLTSFRNLLDQR